MAISDHVNDNELKKFKESTTAAGQPGVVVVNPDGTNVAGSGSGGVQYTEGDVDASITGNAMMMEGAGNTLVPAQGTVANGQKVDITWHIPGTGGTNLGKAEDDPHASADVGVMALAVRKATPANLSGADGDYEPPQIANGRLWVNTIHPGLWSYHEDSTSALTDTEVKAAPGANLALYVTDLVFSTGAATACNIFFEEGSTKVLGPYYLEAVAGRGLALHFVTPKKITANTALTVTTSAAIAHSIDISGFTAPG